jgi:hypothetical protein
VYELDALQCTLFVDASLARRRLEALVAELAGGTLRHPGLPGTYVAGRYVEIEISENVAPAHFGSDRAMLRSRYALDIFALPGQTHPAQLALVSRLLQRLWRLGYEVGVAAEYAGELPSPEEMPGRRHPRPISAWVWEHEAYEWA